MRIQAEVEEKDVLEEYFDFKSKRADRFGVDIDTRKKFLEKKIEEEEKVLIYENFPSWLGLKGLRKGEFDPGKLNQILKQRRSEVLEQYRNNELKVTDEFSEDKVTEVVEVNILSLVLFAERNSLELTVT